MITAWVVFAGVVVDLRLKSSFSNLADTLSVSLILTKPVEIALSNCVFDDSTEFAKTQQTFLIS